MVTANGDEDVISVKTLLTPFSKEETVCYEIAALLSIVTKPDAMLTICSANNRCRVVLFSRHPFGFR
jgi:hypothetical protein